MMEELCEVEQCSEGQETMYVVHVVPTKFSIPQFSSGELMSEPRFYINRFFREEGHES